MGWAENVAVTAERLKTNRILMVKPEGKRQLGRKRVSA